MLPFFEYFEVGHVVSLDRVHHKLKMCVVAAVRAMRALRSIAFVRSLQIIVSALLKTLYSIGNLLLLLFLIMYVFAIIGFYFLGQSDGDPKHWGTIPDALFTLWTYVTVIESSFLLSKSPNAPINGCDTDPSRCCIRLMDGLNFKMNLTQKAWRFQDCLLSSSSSLETLFLPISSLVLSSRYAEEAMHNLHLQYILLYLLQNLEEAQTEEQNYQFKKRHSMLLKKKKFLLQKQERDIHQLLADRTTQSSAAVGRLNHLQRQP